MKIYSFIFILFISISASAQSFNFVQIKTAAIDSLRQSNKGSFITYDYSISVSQDYFPKAQKYNLAQPIIYKTVEKDFTTENSFYYTKADSVVRLIEYQWDILEESYDSVYYKIVNQNKEIISNYFHFRPQEIPETDVKAAKSIWEKDSVYVQQLIMPGLLRIRVLISWK